MTRVYYRFSGAPLDRPGGPWWYRDLPTARVAMSYGRTMQPVCDEVLVLYGPNLPDHDPMAIKPPKEATPL